MTEWQIAILIIAGVPSATYILLLSLGADL